MNRTLSVLALFLLPALLPGGMLHARTALEFFADIPTELFNILDRNTRLDMADYFNAGLNTPSKDIFGGNTRVISASPLRADITVGKGAVVTVGVIPNGSDTIVALIETVKTPTPDSGVKFFKASSWEKIDVAAPTMKDFLTDSGRKATLTEADFPPMMFVSTDFNPEDGVFTFRNRTSDHFRVSEGDDVQYEGLKYLRPEIRMRLKGSKLQAVQ